MNEVGVTNRQEITQQRKRPRDEDIFPEITTNNEANGSTFRVY